MRPRISIWEFVRPSVVRTSVCLSLCWSVGPLVRWSVGPWCVAKSRRIEAYEAFKVYRIMREHALGSIGSSECNFVFLSTHRCTPEVLVFTLQTTMHGKSQLSCFTRSKVRATRAFFSTKKGWTAVQIEANWMTFYLLPIYSLCFDILYLVDFLKIVISQNQNSILRPFWGQY